MLKKFALFITATMLAAAQTPSAPIAAPEGDVIGVGNFLHMVANADRSQEFYHDILGLDLQGGPAGQSSSGPRPLLSTPQIVSLYNAAGGQYRVGQGMVAGNPMRAELVEWNGVARKPVHPRIQDPGAAIMKLTVRNLDDVLARVKKNNVPIVTTGGAPVPLNKHSKAILLRDPDGFFVELLQMDPEPPTKAPATSNYIDVSFAAVVSDTDKMATVFRDGLGFQPQTGPFTNDAGTMELFGLTRGQYRVTTALVPGSSFVVELIEFKGLDRATLHGGPHDPGTAMLRLRVQNIDSVAKTLAGVGVKIISANGTPVELPAAKGPGPRAAIFSAPDNLLIQCVGTPAK